MGQGLSGGPAWARPLAGRSGSRVLVPKVTSPNAWRPARTHERLAGTEVVRTPAERLAALPGWTFAPSNVKPAAGEGEGYERRAHPRDPVRRRDVRRDRRRTPIEDAVTDNPDEELTATGASEGTDEVAEWGPLPSARCPAQLGSADGFPAPFLGGNVGERFRERPLVARRVFGAVLAFAVLGALAQPHELREAPCVTVALATRRHASPSRSTTATRASTPRTSTSGG